MGDEIRMRARLPLACSFGLLLACSEPPDISLELEQYAMLLMDADSQLCRCAILFGYMTYMECSEAMGTVGADEWECLTEALEGHEEAARDYLACANEAYEVYVDCLELIKICDPEIYDACITAHEAELASCPKLPADVQSEFEACTQ
jgi:hypothetical protein